MQKIHRKKVPKHKGNAFQPSRANIELSKIDVVGSVRVNLWIKRLTDKGRFCLISAKIKKSLPNLCLKADTIQGVNSSHNFTYGITLPSSLYHQGVIAYAFGEPSEIRTPDNLIKSQVLHTLSTHLDFLLVLS